MESTYPGGGSLKREFKMDAGAYLEDAKTGLAPGEVRVFGLAQEEEARTWVAG